MDKKFYIGTVTAQLKIQQEKHEGVNTEEYMKERNFRLYSYGITVNLKIKKRGIQGFGPFLNNLIKVYRKFRETGRLKEVRNKEPLFFVQIYI